MSEEIYMYDGKYGRLTVDVKNKKVLVDEIDRERIWKDSGENYDQQSSIFSEIIAELFGDDIEKIFPPREGKREFWAGERSDFGFHALGKDFSFLLDAEGSFFLSLRAGEENSKDISALHAKRSSKNME